MRGEAVTCRTPRRKADLGVPAGRWAAARDVRVVRPLVAEVEVAVVNMIRRKESGFKVQSTV